MTDNDIIKALECCSTASCISNKCPLEKIQDIPKCTTKLTKNALELITRQKAENKKNENIIRLADKTIETQKAEIERLQEVNDSFADIGKMYSEIKAEAIKEFAERLKMLNNSNLIIWNEQIDNLVKEMVGED